MEDGVRPDNAWEKLCVDSTIRKRQLQEWLEHVEDAPYLQCTQIPRGFRMAASKKIFSLVCEKARPAAQPSMGTNYMPISQKGANTATSSSSRSKATVSSIRNSSSLASRSYSIESQLDTHQLGPRNDNPPNPIQCGIKIINGRALPNIAHVSSSLTSKRFARKCLIVLRG
jgi:hypothetical protein